MSIAGKLISAALSVGTAVAVGYGLKKLDEKLEKSLSPEEKTEREVIGTADSSVVLQKGRGGSWKYRFSQKGIVKEQLKAEQACIGFDFVPLRDGVTELELDYCPQGSEKALKTITYTLEVKDGKIIRCDAAGDLEMIK